MKFGLIFDSILLEMTGDEIHGKYYSKLSRDIFNRVVLSDPQTKYQDKRIIRVGRYSKLLLNMFLNGNLKLEDLPNAKEYLTYVYKHNIPLDAKNINSLPDIFNKIEKYKIYDTKELGDIFGALNEKEYDIKLNGKSWLIVVPLSERSSCYLGVNAEWCTTWGKHSMNPSNRGRSNHFSSYNSQGPLYIIINKDNPNEKYQFHFPNKEFMNHRNSAFDHSDLLNNNPEIMNYFFPSLFGGESDFDKEMEYIELLDNEVRNKFLRAGINSSGNPLVNALLNQDKNTINELIVDEEYLSHRFSGGDINNHYLDVEVDGVEGIIDDIRSLIDEYERQKDYSYENVRSEVRNDIEEGEYGWGMESQGFFKEYYTKNKNDIQSEMGIKDFEDFERLFWEGFSEDGTLIDAWVDLVVDKTHTEFENTYSSKKNEITKIITFSEAYSRTQTIRLSIPYFCMFLIKKDISSINGNLEEVIESYVEDNFGGYVEFEDVQIPHHYPEYEEMSGKFDDFFESYVPDDYDPKVCLKYMDVLEKIKTKYFKGNKFENEEVIFELKSNKIDCTNGMIMVFYMNKKTNQKFEGRVKVDNIINYITNRQLFENIIRVHRVL